MFDFLKDILPTITGALGGPIAGIATKFIADKLGVPEDKVLDNLANASPETLAKLKAIDAELKIKLAEIEFKNNELDFKSEELSSNEILSVNKTMQVEAAGEHWPTYSWRPFLGFSFGVSFLAVSTLCCWLAYRAILANSPTAIAMIPSMITAFSPLFAILGGILGVAAWHRGKMQNK